MKLIIVGTLMILGSFSVVSPSSKLDVSTNKLSLYKDQKTLSQSEMVFNVSILEPEDNQKRTCSTTKCWDKIVKNPR